MRSLILLSILSSAAIGSAQTPPTKIGVIIPMSGAFARYGERLKTAIESTKDSQISYIYEDEGCDAKRALTAYEKLSIVDGVKLFLGPWCGSPQAVIAQKVKLRDNFAMLGSSAPQEVFALSGHKMYSTQHTIESEAQFIADQMNRRKFKKVSLVFFDNSFSRAHEKAFREHFKGEVNQTYAYANHDISELKSIALKLKQSGVDAVFAPDAFPLMSGFTRELDNIGLNTLPVFAPYSAQAADVAEAVSGHSGYLFYSYPEIGEEDALDHFPLLAAKILHTAIAKCGSSPSCVRDTIKSSHQFDDFGALVNTFVLKTIVSGKFVKVAN